MRGQWTGALLGAGAMLVLAVIAAVLYLYLPLGKAPAKAEEAPPPTTLQNMTLEAQFKGPLKDTVIQRWRDPDTNLICYIYLPIVVQHSPPTPTGFVQYGANGIGSISCLRNP